MGFEICINLLENYITMKKEIYFTLFVLLTLINVGKSQIPGYVPTGNLEGWWSFDGNANDATTNGNNFTNYSASLTTDRFGTSNKAYDFNGTSQYLLLSSPSFIFGQSSTFTVSCWIERTSAGYGVALMHGSTASGNFIWNIQTGSNGNLQFGTNKQQSSWYWAQSTYPTNQWIHIAATYDNGSMTLYKDGVQVATQTNSHTSVNQTTLPFYIGRGVSGAYFDGKIDDIGVWSSVLTSSQIMALYTGCDIGITAQPSNKNATIGSSVSYWVGASNPNVSFQWEVDNGSGFQSVSNGGQYTGATNDTLTVSNVTTANNGELYRCVFKNDTICYDTSLAVTLNVCGALTSQPSNVSVPVNNMAHFIVASNDPLASFQWQIESGGVFNDLTNGILYSGADTDTLTKKLCSMIDNGKIFRCLVTSGSCIDTSDEVSLTVYDNIGLDEYSEASIRIYPNPAHDFIVIEKENGLESQLIQLYNGMGQLIFEEKMKEDRLIISVAHLLRGVYFIGYDGEAAMKVILN